MHTLQPKHTKLNKEEVEKLLNKFNISLLQLPKISEKDPALPVDVEEGDVFKIERKLGDVIEKYYRVVV